MVYYVKLSFPTLAASAALTGFTIAPEAIALFDWSELDLDQTRLLKK